MQNVQTKKKNLPHYIALDNVGTFLVAIVSDESYGSWSMLQFKPPKNLATQYQLWMYLSYFLFAWGGRKKYLQFRQVTNDLSCMCQNKKAKSACNTWNWSP